MNKVNVITDILTKANFFHLNRYVIKVYDVYLYISQEIFRWFITQVYILHARLQICSFAGCHHWAITHLLESIRIFKHFMLKNNMSLLHVLLKLIYNLFQSLMPIYDYVPSNLNCKLNFCKYYPILKLLFISKTKK